MDAASIKINGLVVCPDGSYRATVNSFLANGGDRFSVLKDGVERFGGDVDLDALIDYFVGGGTVEPGPKDCITRMHWDGQPFQIGIATWLSR